MRRRDTIRILPLLLLAGSALADSRPGLATALEAIDSNEIRRDLEWVAADERGGRDTPSEGLEETARFLAQRLGELGFEHGAPDGYLYRYPLSWRELDVERSRLELTAGEKTETLRFGSDYFLERSRDTTDLYAEGPVVYVGEGARSDFGRRDLTGRWVLVEDEGRGSRRASDLAAEAGALGMIIVPGRRYDEDPYAERYATATRLAERGILQNWSGPETGDVFPTVRVAAGAWARVRPRVPELAGRGTPRPGTELGLSARELRCLTHPGGRRLVENVAGLWRGSDPELAREVIVVSAHYDHVGSREGEIFNGADDNGSGTVGMLALARGLATYGPLRRSVLLLWVSAEEKGLWGSEAWTKRPWLPEGMYPIADLNIDMIGRNAPDELSITPTRRLRDQYNAISRLAESLSREEGFARLKSADAYWARSDQKNFAENLGLAVAFLFADVHEDYHRPTDTVDKIDFDKVRRTSRLLLRILEGLQTDELELGREGLGPDAFAALVRQGRAQSDLEALWAAGIEWSLDNAGAPAEDLAALAAPGLERDELDRPLDPWGTPYLLDDERITSLGGDRAPGGVEEAADLSVP